MFIGKKEIKTTIDNTFDNIEVVEVVFGDNSSEVFSKLMYDQIVSEEQGDDTSLRDRRVHPIVKDVLGVLKKWGIKLNELQYMSALLNTSLQESEKKVIELLYKDWIPSISSTDDVDLITIDKILKEKSKNE